MGNKFKFRIINSDSVDSSTMWDLEHSGYYFVSGRDLQGEKQYYYFRPFFHETARHAILVFELIEYLKHYTKDVKEYLSRKPDIIFKINGKEWAIEVETGIIFKKNRKQFLEKVESLKYSYKKRWFFVITDRNLLKSYKRYGKTYTRRNIIGKIEKMMWENGVYYKAKQ